MPLQTPQRRRVTSFRGQRPDVIGGWQVATKTPDRWFNTDAFASPELGTFGHLGRNVVIGPGINNWDVSLQKMFTFDEQWRLEFRAEMFNAPHHFSYWGVGTSFGSGSFGQVTSAKDPRTLQLGLKLHF